MRWDIQAVAQAHLPTNEPIRDCRSPINWRRLMPAPDSYQKAGGQNEIGKHLAWKPQATETCNK